MLAFCRLHSAKEPVFIRISVLFLKGGMAKHHIDLCLKTELTFFYYFELCAPFVAPVNLRCVKIDFVSKCFSFVLASE